MCRWTYIYIPGVGKHYKENRIEVYGIVKPMLQAPCSVFLGLEYAMNPVLFQTHQYVICMQRISIIIVSRVIFTFTCARWVIKGVHFDKLIRWRYCKQKIHLIHLSYGIVQFNSTLHHRWSIFLPSRPQNDYGSHYTATDWE